MLQGLHLKLFRVRFLGILIVMSIQIKDRWGATIGGKKWDGRGSPRSQQGGAGIKEIMEIMGWAKSRAGFWYFVEADLPFWLTKPHEDSGLMALAYRGDISQDASAPRIYAAAGDRADKGDRYDSPNMVNKADGVLMGSGGDVAGEGFEGEEDGAEEVEGGEVSEKCHFIGESPMSRHVSQ